MNRTKRLRRVKAKLLSPLRDNAYTQVLNVRSVKASDAKNIAKLSTRLGYPVSARQMVRRIGVVRTRRDQKLFAAELNQNIVGWLEIFLPLSVLNFGKAEIGALIVDDHYRRFGVGSALMNAAHGWAERKRCPFIYLRSNVIRKKAHKFYKHKSYAILKTQYVFQKLFSKTKRRNVE